MTREEQYGYLSAISDANNIIMSHMEPGATDEATFKLLNQIVNEISANYDKKFAK